MSYASHYEPEQFDSPENDLRDDPAYIAFSAMTEGEHDAAVGIDLPQGMRKLRERNASTDEMKSYHTGYLIEMVLNAAGLR